MLATIVELSLRFRLAALSALAALLLAGGFAARELAVDALPDVSTVQVTVLTEAPGLSPTEVERMITVPLEAALNGVPRLVELRSVSRPGLSAVTLVFRDGTDVWFARQLVGERLREVQAELPAFVAAPSLAPVSTGLGEIFIFVVSSPHHSAMQLRSLLDWEIVPRLRGVPGVVEINTMGGRLKQFHVVADPARLRAFGLSLADLEAALAQANLNVGGGYVDRVGETYLVRGVGLLQDERDIGAVVIDVNAAGTPILVRQVADVRVGSALRYGVTTADGVGEVVTGTVMMLLGANSREVTQAVRQRVAEVQAELPPGVVLEPIYDRSEFVGRTLATVLKNLVEGALVVFVVLVLFLGSVRGALAVLVGIPASMSVALLGMHAFGVTGDLMSLGAIDFGFLVDGPIVILEAVIAGLAGTALADKRELSREIARIGAGVARPVGFAVTIIMLVYVPLFGLEGTEGKMFRPMAATMALALFGALVYAIFFFPAVLVTFVPPPSSHGPRWLLRITSAYERALPALLRWRAPLVAGAAVAVVGGGVLLTRLGADFVPRIDEGDIVLTIRRAPSVALDEAGRLDLAVQKVLLGFPEVKRTLAFTGRAELAFDPVGNDNTDLLVTLAPREAWRTARDLDGLSLAIKSAVESRVPGTFVSVSQPIEDRTNELISGSRADVAIQIYGADLDALVAAASRVGAVVRTVPGTGDVRIERLLGMPSLVVEVDRERLARHGARVEDVFLALEAARAGLRVGQIYEGNRRYDLRVLVPPASSTPAALGDLFVRAAAGTLVPLAEVATVREVEGPATIRREALTRTVRVEVNLRGRDLVSWVDEAQRMVAASVPLAPGMRVTWGGQFENFERASARLALVGPASLAIIFLMLLLLLRHVPLTIAVFTLVPLATVGGTLGLWARELTFSLPAAVGFIALAGVAVLSGVVLVSDVQRRVALGMDPDRAVREGSAHSLRAILTTATVAALGFLPMALSTGAGAEVQRPLATVVVAGIACVTVLLLAVFPGIVRLALPSAPRGTDGSPPPPPPVGHRPAA
jgi:cobalt-zinc-cadmium resistance protein CzcA